jgi:hypothetical protein
LLLSTKHSITAFFTPRISTILRDYQGLRSTKTIISQKRSFIVKIDNHSKFLPIRFEQQLLNHSFPLCDRSLLLAGYRELYSMPFPFAMKNDGSMIIVHCDLVKQFNPRVCV